MPYNGSGTFTPYTPGNPVVPGTVISSTAFNATQSDIAAGLSNAVTRDGQSPPSANLPMGGKKLTGLVAGTVAGDSLRWEQLFSQGTEQDLASAATTDVGAQNTTVLRITGTTGITSFGTNYNGPRFVRFSDVLTLTHNASTLILPTSANITTAAGDRAILTPVGNPASGWQVLAYQRANGAALNGVQSGAVTTSGLTMAADRMLGRLTTGSGAVEELSFSQVLENLPVRNYIDGLALSTAGSSTTMSIAAGVATDSTNVRQLSLAATSKTTASWAVGAAVGGKLSAAAIANNTWYYWFLIRRPDTGVVDIGFDVSPTSPTLPTNYTQFRYIGASLTNASAQWVKFQQYGDVFMWDNLGTLDLNGAATTTAALVTLTVPRGRKVLARMNLYSVDNTSGGPSLLVSDPDQSSVAASITAWPLAQNTSQGTPTESGGNYAECFTNTSAQIRYVGRTATTTGRIATLGWLDQRGKNE